MQDHDRDGHPIGTGPGVTGASGDIIENTGGESGIGGTGHDDESLATGQHPDERSIPGQQEAMDGAEEGDAARAPGSVTGTIGGGGPHGEGRRGGGNPGRPGGGGIGALGDQPGGVRKVEE